MYCQLDAELYIFSINILKCVDGYKWLFSFGVLLRFPRLVASANPPHCSRRCQHKNEPRGISVSSKSWITVTRRLPFQQLRQAQNQSYHNASQCAVINSILFSSRIKTVLWFTRPNNKESLWRKLRVSLRIRFDLKPLDDYLFHYLLRMTVQVLNRSFT